MAEAVVVANIIFEPLVGELFRSQLVQQAAPTNGDFVTPTVVGAGEHDYAMRDLRYTKSMFALLTGDREFVAAGYADLQARHLDRLELGEHAQQLRLRHGDDVGRPLPSHARAHAVFLVRAAGHDG